MHTRCNLCSNPILHYHSPQLCTSTENVSKKVSKWHCTPALDKPTWASENELLLCDKAVVSGFFASGDSDTELAKDDNPVKLFNPFWDASFEVLPPTAAINSILSVSISWMPVNASFGYFRLIQI